MTSFRLSTHDAIIEAAFVLFNEQPSASLADIATRAGVGRATLHRHFPSRGDMLRAMARIARTELNEAIEHATRHAISEVHGLQLMLEAVIPLASRQWFLANEDLSFDESLEKENEVDRKEMVMAMERAKKEGGLRTDIPTSWLIASYENLIYAAWSVVRDGELTTKQAISLSWQTFMHGNKG